MSRVKYIFHFRLYIQSVLSNDFLGNGKQKEKTAKVKVVLWTNTAVCNNFVRLQYFFTKSKTSLIFYI